MADHSDKHHIMPVKTYLLVFGVLMVLTIITVGAAMVNLGRWNVPVALTIATIKATFVVLFFMHLKNSERLVSLFLIASLSWLALLLVGTMVDPPTRTRVTFVGPMDAEAPRRPYEPRPHQPDSVPGQHR